MKHHTDQNKEAMVEPQQASSFYWLRVQGVICKPQMMIGFPGFVFP